MKFGRRAMYCLLLALICLSVLVRIPRTSHETGVDSFFIHNLATAITEQARIPWVLNALGYFGWYPLSYPSGVPTLISGFSQTSGLTGEGAILCLSLLYGVLGILVGFMMARAFWPDDLFALSVAAIVSLAPRFMAFTIWSASSRNLFMVLIPILLWALIRSYRRPTVSNLIMLVSTLFLMLATHRLTILLAVVIIAFIAAYVFVYAHRVVRIRFPRILLGPAFRRWVPYLAILAIAATALFMLFGTEVLKEYETGAVCSGPSLQAEICNLGVSVTRSVGLALPFALAGVFSMVGEYNKGFLEAFLTIALLALIPTLFLRQYTGFYILPFLALFAGYGILGLAKWLRRAPRAKVTAVALSLVLTVGFSLGILGIETAQSTSMPDASYTSGLYLLSLPRGNFVANDGLLAIRVASTTGIGGLPIGGAGTTHQSPELLIMGTLNASDVFSREQRIALLDMTIEDDSPFVLREVNALNDWTGSIMGQNVDGVSSKVIEKYHLSYYLENDALRDAYYAFGNVYDAHDDPRLVRFPISLHASKYKIYDGSAEDIYLAFPPLPD